MIFEDKYVKKDQHALTGQGKMNSRSDFEIATIMVIRESSFAHFLTRQPELTVRLTLR
jgi:hypothetical protein